MRSLAWSPKRQHMRAKHERAHASGRMGPKPREPQEGLPQGRRKRRKNLANEQERPAERVQWTGEKNDARLACSAPQLATSFSYRQASRIELR